MTTMEDQQLRTATQAARKAMIDSQLRTSGVNEAFVLQRMAEIAREDFVPEAAKGCAYTDRCIPLGDGAMLAPPLFHGKMLQEARPSLQDKVLLVDGGSGYMAALLRPLVGSLDIMSAEEAASGNGRKNGFTLLLIDGAVEQVPASLVKRLADDARIVTGLVDDGVTRLAYGCKAGGELALSPLCEIGMPVLPAFAAPKDWSF
jgi:protein-L-isoaspartate(D-aspartate) O-methyltransferase